MQTIWAKTALLPHGWADGVRVDIDADGRIAAVDENAEPGSATRVGVLLPAPVNLHSHAFQRAFAGLSEARGPGGSDSFWTWRTLMYQFLDQLGPDDIEAITGFVQMQMLEAGYGAVAEFHYLHHAADGTPYADPAEMSARVVAAAATSGIGLTLLPVAYERGGCDGRALGAGQVRFGNDPDRFAALVEAAGRHAAALPDDCGLGVAPHSLRAVSPAGLKAATSLLQGRPIHIHIAEQVSEVEEVVNAYKMRPVDWLILNHDVDARWCLIHATHMTSEETRAVAASVAVAGLCPITEANLGDGIFDGVRYFEAEGRFGVGSDSNIRISLSEELRTLEYSQRLRDRGRALIAAADRSTGRALYDAAVAGGAQAAGRDAGAISVGRYADLNALDADAIELAGLSSDTLLDAFIFAGDDSLVTDVWSAGRHLVADGRHHAREVIVSRYRETMTRLKGAL